mmetsp:Transcript_19198/g.44821  ORF Transcript_19198/g.44821 Transcript_19198/m.44821 type:complete len:201 (+) Transcript_19198:917-1519(+)
MGLMPMAFQPKMILLTTLPNQLRCRRTRECSQRNWCPCDQIKVTAPSMDLVGGVEDRTLAERKMFRETQRTMHFPIPSILVARNLSGTLKVASMHLALTTTGSPTLVKTNSLTRLSSHLILHPTTRTELMTQMTSICHHRQIHTPNQLIQMDFHSHRQKADQLGRVKQIRCLGTLATIRQMTTTKGPISTVSWEQMWTLP